jgi:hypothetical protein
VRGDDGHDRSFITRDFNRGSGKENGTIPFYRRFFDRINKIIKIQNLQVRMHSVYTKNTLSEQSVYTKFTLSEQVVRQPILLPTSPSQNGFLRAFWCWQFTLIILDGNS